MDAMLEGADHADGEQLTDDPILGEVLDTIETTLGYTM
jgi:hypothetical protein